MRTKPVRSISSSRLDNSVHTTEGGSHQAMGSLTICSIGYGSDMPLACTNRAIYATNRVIFSLHKSTLVLHKSIMHEKPCPYSQQVAFLGPMIQARHTNR